MEKLEQQLQQRESAYLYTVDTILKMECTHRTKIAMIYRQYVKYQVDIEDIVANAQVVIPSAPDIEHLEVSSPTF